MENAAGFEIIYANRGTALSFDTLAEAERFARWRGEPCKIWAFGPNDGWNNWQKLIMEFV